MDRSIGKPERLRIFVTTTLLLLAAAAHADPLADRCGGSKEKAAGRYGQAVFSCRAAAMKSGGSVDPACVSRAAGKLAAAFAKAEAAGGCATTGDDGSVATAIDGDASDAAAALAPAATDEARACAHAKMRAAGKDYSLRLGCYAKRARSSEGPDAECLAKSESRQQLAFEKAEARGGCSTSGDAPGVRALVASGVEDDVRLVSPVCGDELTGPTQTCDGADDAACPGLCTSGCVCVSCGNASAEFPEECDDGGMADGDGCSSSCQLENTSAICAGVPSFSGTGIDAVHVADFVQPIDATAPPLDPSRLFVVEREGRIRIVDLADDTVKPAPFLDITDLVSTDGERGLLGLAFDPDYETNRRFFVNYTNLAGDTTIARYQASPGDPDLADESTAAILLVIAQPESNHNGGQIAFGPDGYLYVGMGDGGGGGDPHENGQDDAELLGKMLRMDTDVAGAPYYAVPPDNPHYASGSSELELIWAKGLRNPWRFSFDRATGDLVISDVGQGSREEIDLQPASSSGGENYGWDIFEGSVCYEPDPAPSCPADPVAAGFTMPVFEYAHFGGCTSITGGYVYRGCAMPDLSGTYFFSDYCHNFVETIEFSGGAAINHQVVTTDLRSTGVTFGAIGSFGQDARGELYIVDLFGSLYRIEHD